MWRKTKMELKKKFKWINLGCGNRRMDNCINLDRDTRCKPDIVADFNDKLPFEDNSVEYVYCSHVIEHVDDIFHFMYEIWRVCVHEAEVHIIAPNYNYPYWAIQPSHKRFIRQGYFETWDTEHMKQTYSPTFTPTMNYDIDTKGAKFKVNQEGTLNEQKELFFKMTVIKK